MIWLKALHISALLVWCASLLYLPGLLAAHRQIEGEQAFINVRRASRFAYIALGAPAAVLAIGSGTALLFVADALHGWMFLKLAFVGMLVGVQIFYGTVLFRLDDPQVAPPGPWLVAAPLVVLLAIGFILWLVLGEPTIPDDWLPDWMREPGGLRRQFSLAGLFLTMPI